jgi:hypothetical protein
VRGQPGSGPSFDTLADAIAPSAPFPGLTHSHRTTPTTPQKNKPQISGGSGGISPRTA